MKIYAPAEGKGWVEGYSMFPENNRRWRAEIEPGLWLAVTTSSLGSIPQFVVSRVTEQEEGEMTLHSLPTPVDLGRVQEEFGVYGWRSIFPMRSVNPRALGMCLMLRAVEKDE